MFVDQQPIEFTVKSLPKTFVPTISTFNEGFQPQTIINIPAPSIEASSAIP